MGYYRCVCLKGIYVSRLNAIAVSVLLCYTHTHAKKKKWEKYFNLAVQTEITEIPTDSCYVHFVRLQTALNFENSCSTGILSTCKCMWFMFSLKCNGY